MLEGLIITQGTPKIISASSSLMSASGMTPSQILDLYQVVNSQFDSTLMVMSVIIAVLTLAVTIAIAFFAVKQINVDREISNYKEEIKKQAELAGDQVKKISEQFALTSKLLADGKKLVSQFKEESKKPFSDEKQKEIKNLEKKIEDLAESLTYQRGVLAGSPIVSGVAGGTTWTSVSGTASGSSVPFNLFGFYVTCKKCGRSYSSSDGPDLINLDGTGTAYIKPLGGSKCPDCGNIN